MVFGHFIAQRPKKRRNAHGSKPGSRLAAVAIRFMLFMGSYSMHFQLFNRDQSLNARNYLECLSIANLTKNIERMAERNPKAEYQSLQQFITDSPWSYREVMDHVAVDANTLIGNPQGTALVIDESGYPKKGKNSVGVARQWLGCIGKVDNGQVAVYGALVNGTNYCLIDSRLYLPEEWTSDEKRLDKAKVPQQERTFKTKETIALEIVAHSRQLGLQFGWVDTDAGYGKGLAFPLALEKMGEIFVCDVHKDHLIYLEKPQLEVPAYSGRGRMPKNPQPKPGPIRVDKFIAGQPETAWQKIAVREGTKGILNMNLFFPGSGYTARNVAQS
jgi:SRSO17 transposase